MVYFTFSTTAVSVLALALACFSTSTGAFQLNYPNPNNDGYWVTNATNILNWKANTTDPSFFSVQLLNSNNSQLNGNFQIGNALLTRNGSANIFIDQIPEGQYNVLFVNSSQYALNNPEVFYTSPFFSIRPNGTEQPSVQPNTDSNPDSPFNSGPSSSNNGDPSRSSSASADATLSPTGSAAGEGNSAGSLANNWGLRIGSVSLLIVLNFGLGFGSLALLV